MMQLITESHNYGHHWFFLKEIDYNRGFTVILSTRQTENTGFVLSKSDLNSELTVFLV